MLPPAEAGERPGGRWERPPLGWRVLAERSQSVAPVGAWVERASGQPEESGACASAFQVEEELKEQQLRKAARLRCFQGEVRQRVNQQVRMRRKQQLQKSWEATERESRLAALCPAPQRNTCLYRSHPQPVIGGPQAPAAPLQQGEMPSQPLQLQAAKLSQTMKQARLKLASCRTQGSGPPQLPGGVWRSECYDGSVKDSSLPVPPRSLPAAHSASLLLWAGVDQEETKKQHQSEYLRQRHLFLSMERQQVKEQQRHRERQKRAAEIKSQQETQRRDAEQRMQEMGAQRGHPSSGEGAWAAQAQAQPQERKRREVKASQQRRKECMRYMEALRAQIKEKIRLSNIDLPPLCSCGSDFWDSHPDTCANNCIFYKNHKAYSQALLSLVSSCTPSRQEPLQGWARLCAGAGKHL